MNLVLDKATVAQLVVTSTVRPYVPPLSLREAILVQSTL
jgi:hypothetical protein